MFSWAWSLGRTTSRVIFALAVFVLTFGPILDSAAKAAPSDAPQSSITRVLRALDVVDDVLDHVSGAPAGVHQQQMQLPHALPSGAGGELVVLSTATQAWNDISGPSPASALLDGQDRPPRS